ARPVMACAGMRPRGWLSSRFVANTRATTRHPRRRDQDAAGAGERRRGHRRGGRGTRAVSDVRLRGPFMRVAALALCLAAVSTASAKPNERSTCLSASGDEAVRCLDAYIDVSSVTPVFSEAAVRDNCTADIAYALWELGVDAMATDLHDAFADNCIELLHLLTTF